MPSFNSINGIWKAAHERAFDPKTGEIYNGPDRAAEEYIKSEGGTVGQDAAKDPQLIQASRNAGFNSVEEYLKQFAPTEKQVAEKKAADAVIVTHADPKKKPGVRPSKGGFNEDTQDPMAEVLKKG